MAVKQISYKPENEAVESWIEKEVDRLNETSARRKKYTKQEIMDRIVAAAMIGKRYK